MLLLRMLLMMMQPLMLMRKLPMIVLPMMRVLLLHMFMLPHVLVLLLLERMFSCSLLHTVLAAACCRCVGGARGAAAVALIKTIYRRYGPDAAAAAPAAGPAAAD